MNPENNNNNPAPTTVGGVTFGAGLSSAPAGAPTPQNSQTEPVDPIIQSTGEEFDAVMNGTAPTEPNFNEAPIPENFEPAQNDLSVPVASPTHFDDQKTVRPVINDPGHANIPNPKAKKDKQTDADKQVKKLSMMTIIFGILAGVFMILSIVGLTSYFSSQDEIASLTSDNRNKANIIKAVAESAGVDDIENPDQVPVYKATTGYIYISEWNIKIKIPDTLEKVSYILNQNYRPSICFNAVGKGVQYFPDFANIALNPGRMGCLTRIATTEGEFDAATGQSFGTKVYTDDSRGYSYFYTPSTDYSKDTANLGLEHTAVQIIKNMLTDNIEVYE